MSTEAEKLENEIIAAIDAAQDARALEDVRVAALGKKGSVSALLKTLGGMSANERQVNGPLFQRFARCVTGHSGEKNRTRHRRA